MMVKPLVKDIPGYEGFYRVDDQGAVWSCRDNGRGQDKKGEWRKMKLTQDPDGYQVVNLRLHSKSKTRSVHQLVLETFVGPRPSSRSHTRHLNSVPSDNRLANLKWGTARQNSQDRKVAGTFYKGETCHSSKLTQEQVDLIRGSFTGRRGEQARFAEKYGVSPMTISDIIRGVTW